ncbi:MAG: ABC transporter permease [Blautia sp.]|nr:ABC transporter permease [Blautia sp.]
MEEQWTTHIKSTTGIFDFNLHEIKKYKDLIFLFAKRDYVTRYKQTVLGPLWLIITPLVTVLLHSFIFGSVANLAPDGSPQLLFYMTSNIIWSYFALCFRQISNTFTTNAGIFGKVYFPRIIAPIATVLIGLVDLLIQFLLLAVMIGCYALRGVYVHLSVWTLLSPLLIFQTAILGLGCGIIVSSLTTRYRDLIVLVGFGLQLLQYISPTVYPLAVIPERWRTIYLLNPLAPIITIWRYAVLGVGELPLRMWGISWLETGLLFLVGLILFNKVEKTFMDTV